MYICKNAPEPHWGTPPNLPILPSQHETAVASYARQCIATYSCYVSLYGYIGILLLRSFVAH